MFYGLIGTIISVFKMNNPNKISPSKIERIVPTCARTNAYEIRTEFLSFQFSTHIYDSITLFSVSNARVYVCMRFSFLCSFQHAVQLGGHKYISASNTDSNKNTHWTVYIKRVYIECDSCVLVCVFLLLDLSESRFDCVRVFYLELELELELNKR